LLTAIRVFDTFTETKPKEKKLFTCPFSIRKAIEFDYIHVCYRDK